MKKYSLLFVLLSSTVFANGIQEDQVSFNDTVGKAFTKIVEVTGQTPVVDEQESATVTADAKITCTRTRINEHSCVVTILK